MDSAFEYSKKGPFYKYNKSSGSSVAGSSRRHGGSSGSFKGGFGASKPNYPKSKTYKTQSLKEPSVQKKKKSSPKASHSTAYKREKPSYTGKSGYTVYIDGSNWGSSDSIPYMPDFSFDINPYKEMLSEMEKLRQKNLEIGKKALSDEADSFFREAYINHSRSMNSLDEKLFNAGSTGGLSESTRAYMDASYKNALRDIEMEKLKNIGALQAEYAQGSAKDHAMTMDKISKETDRLRSEKRAYEKMLEERLYKERRAEREFKRRLYERYYDF